MVKALSFFKRRSGMPVEAFQAYWRASRPGAVVRLRGVRRYVQSHTLPGAYRRGEPVYDGICEIWFDDTQAMRALAGTPAYAAVQADEAKFIERATMGLIITEEHVIKDGPVPAAGATPRAPRGARRTGAGARRAGTARRSRGSTTRRRCAPPRRVPSTRPCGPTRRTSSRRPRRSSSRASTSSSPDEIPPPAWQVAPPVAARQRASRKIRWRPRARSPPRRRPRAARASADAPG